MPSSSLKPSLATKSIVSGTRRTCSGSPWGAGSGLSPFDCRPAVCDERRLRPCRHHDRNGVVLGRLRRCCHVASASAVRQCLPPTPGNLKLKRQNRLWLIVGVLMIAIGLWNTRSQYVRL